MTGYEPHPCVRESIIIIIIIIIIIGSNCVSLLTLAPHRTKAWLRVR